MTNELCKKFYMGLMDKYGIDKEEFNDMDFKCCGIFKPPSDIKLSKNTKLIPIYLDCFDTKYSIFFTKKEKDNLKDRFLYKKKCVCGQKINVNCFIYSRKEDILLNIGSCCNLNFNENGNNKYCAYCNEKHNNRKDNICNECRNKYKQCSKCGEYKKDHYDICTKCKFNTLYNNCGRCDKKHVKPTTYKYCFDCNLYIKTKKFMNL